MSTTYSTGTVSVGNNSTTLTGTSTAWTTAGLRAGDLLHLAGLTVPIAAVVSATEITLARPWPGSAQTGANYDLQQIADDVRALVAANTLLQSLGDNGTLNSLAALAGDPNTLPYFSADHQFGAVAFPASVRDQIADASLYARDNLLGAVSQTGGNPTGAVIERGSTANGEFVRFADGTQICTGTAQSVAASDATWVYPAAFAVPPVILGAPALGPRIFSTGSTLPTTTQCTFIAWFVSTALSRSTTTTNLLALGRWF